MFKIVRKEFQLGGQQVVLETGRIARQAQGAVIITMGGVQVLVAVAASKKLSQAKTSSRLPLTIKKKLMLPAVFPVVTSSVKVALQKKKH